MRPGRRGTQAFRRGTQFPYGSEFRASLNSSIKGLRIPPGSSRNLNNCLRPSSKTLGICKRDAEEITLLQRSSDRPEVQRYPPTESLCEPKAGTGRKGRTSWKS